MKDNSNLFKQKKIKSIDKARHPVFIMIRKNNYMMLEIFLEKCESDATLLIDGETIVRIIAYNACYILLGVKKKFDEKIMQLLLLKCRGHKKFTKLIFHIYTRDDIDLNGYLDYKFLDSLPRNTLTNILSHPKNTFYDRFFDLYMSPVSIAACVEKSSISGNLNLIKEIYKNGKLGVGTLSTAAKVAYLAGQQKTLHFFMIDTIINPYREQIMYFIFGNNVDCALADLLKEILHIIVGVVIDEVWKNMCQDDSHVG